MSQRKKLTIVTGISCTGKSTWSKAFSQRHQCHLQHYDSVMLHLYRIARISEKHSISDLHTWHFLDQTFDMRTWLRSMHMHYLALQGYQDAVWEGYWYLQRRHRGAMYRALRWLKWQYDITLLRFCPPLDFVRRNFADREGVQKISDSYAEAIDRALERQRSVLQLPCEKELQRFNVQYREVYDLNAFGVEELL